MDSALDSDYFLSQGNDAVAWANRGLVDVVFHMDYGRCPDWNSALKARKQLHDGQRMIMLLADFTILDQGVVPYDGRLLADFVRIARMYNFQGVSFYHRPQLSGQQAVVLSGTVFREKARPIWTRQP